MLLSYLRLAFRNLRKHRVYSVINVLGLAGGTAVSILMLLFAYNVLTFDAFHTASDDLYFLYRTRPTPEGAVPVNDTWYPLLDEVTNTYPEVVGGVRFLQFQQWVQQGDARYLEAIDFVDPTLFTTFDGFRLAHGDPATALAEPQSVVLTPETARRYFGDADPMGKTLTINFDRDYTVTGVLAGVPPNSTFTFDLIVPLQSLPFVHETGWDSSYLFTFVRLAEGTSPGALEARFPQLVEQFFLPAEKGDLKLMPLRDYNDSLTGRERYAYVLLAIGLGILFIACINFTNLATARSMQRAREIGMRKVLGASRPRLVAQFLGEALLVSFLALCAGCALAELLLPAFNDFVGLDLALDLFARPERLAALLALGAATGVVAGSYPAFYLSRFTPIATLKGEKQARPGGVGLRNGLVVLQFALSMILLVGVGVMYRQIEYMKERDLQFDRDGVVVLPVAPRDFADREEAVERIATLGERLAQLPGAASVSASGVVPSRFGGNFTLVRPEGEEDRSPLDWRYVVVDDRFFDTYGIDVVEGRGFSRAFGTDAETGVILNRAALRVLGWDRAADRKLRSAGGRRAWTVLGVVEDFHYQSVTSAIEPILFFYGGERSGAYTYLSVRLRQPAGAAALDPIRAEWEAMVPGRAFDYFFVDDAYEGLYETEENTARIVTYAALLAVLIACLGLLGLAAFAVVQRTKEIGVRKVMGASVADIVVLFGRQFAAPILVAVVAAAPAAYFLMDRWLQDFPYRIAMAHQAGVMAAAAAVALAVALLTVSYQTVRAARANPVKALRYE